MTKPIEEVIKEMRLVAYPAFKEAKDNEYQEVDEKLTAILTEANLSNNDICDIIKNYYIDWSSDNSDEWVIKYDPNNAKIIYPGKVEMTADHAANLPKP
jgi:hypothetical protein